MNDLIKSFSGTSFAMRYVALLEALLKDELCRPDYKLFLSVSTPNSLFITKTGKYYEGSKDLIISKLSETICLKIQHMYWRSLDHIEITQSPPEHDSLLMIKIFLDSTLNFQNILTNIVNSWFDKLSPPPRKRHRSDSH